MFFRTLSQPFNSSLIGVYSTVLDSTINSEKKKTETKGGDMGKFQRKNIRKSRK
jgi:hypothetical protein